MDSFEQADLQRRVRRMIMNGVVHSVQVNPPRCRVSFGIDPVTEIAHVSGWLNWAAPADAEQQCWSVPAVGAPVIVLSEGGDTGLGLVFPAGFMDDRLPPSGAVSEHVTRYADGATFSYDTQTHHASVTLPAGGRLIVTAPGGIVLKGDTTVDGRLTVKKDVLAEGEIFDFFGSVNDIRVAYGGHNHRGDSGGQTGGPNQPVSPRPPSSDEPNED
ncbi:phage baseplate assembly protein V [Enterobacter ludwigii]